MSLSTAWEESEEPFSNLFANRMIRAAILGLIFFLTDAPATGGA